MKPQTAAEGSRDLAAFLKLNPDLRQIEILLTDLSGGLLGKRLPVSHAEALLAGRVGMPACLMASDITGETVPSGDAAGILESEGDFPLRVVPGSAARVPWLAQPTVQVVMTMDDGLAAPGTPFLADPRNALSALLERFAALGIRPVVAVELEFYLVDPAAAAERRVAAPRYPGEARRAAFTPAYRPQELLAFDAFLAEVAETCRLQELPAECVLSEYGPGQFEINLHHLDDAARACDHAVLLKRAVKAVARRHGLLATFMAKPHESQVGSGMHIHASLAGRDGRNLFADPAEGERRLRHAVAGLLETMPALTAVFAPNANAYRRYRPGQLAPVRAAWARNNRNAALRVIDLEAESRRVEHRVAGADANPYLAMAAVLGGILLGLERGRDPGAELERENFRPDHAPLPASLEAALALFRASADAKAILGATAHEWLLLLRDWERAKFERAVTPLEIEWYLERV